MTLWMEACKMIAISSVLSFVLCVVVVFLLGLSERSFLLFTPSLKWPVFAMMAIIWGVSLKLAHWWVFERYTFYGGK